MSTQPSAYMAGPPSMPAGSHEMRDYYTTQDPPRPTPHTAPSITPYLGLRARLSQIWINRWTILLLLVLARTLIAISGINYDLTSARREAHTACSGVEAKGSAMASMPHYMSPGVNELAATGVEKDVNGLMEMTTLSVTGVEEIVVFVINMMTSTYLCLITLAVSGSLHVALKVVEDAQRALNKSLQAIGDDMSSNVGAFDSVYNDFIGKLGSSLTGLLESTVTPPKIDLNSTLDALHNLQLPSNLDQGLTKLNSSIPTFAQVQNFTDNAIRLPFEEVKQLINQSMGGYQFDRSIFPVPAKEELTFCSDNNGINDFFDELAALVELARKIFIAVLIIAAVAVCIPMAWREIKRWRTMQERSQLVHSNAHDPMDVVYIVSRPYTSTAGIKAASRFKSPRHQILVRWVFAYATSAPALFVLSLALAGLFSCVCQAILLKSLEKEIPDLTNQVSSFADKVVNSLNNASEQWSIGVNKVIDSTNQDINKNLFSWVNITTGALNDTLNVFVNGTMGVLNETFGGTVLYQPITEVLNCLLLLKIAGIEKALTWISDNAHIDISNLPNNTFTLGAVTSIASDNSNPSDSFLSTVGAQASDDISAAVVRFTTGLSNAIRTEALIWTCVLLTWVAILHIGIIRALMLWFGREKTRGEGGAPNLIAHPQDEVRGLAMTTVERPPSTEPAPKYSASADAANLQEDEYQEQKFGFAGQRNYGDSLRREATTGGHSRVSSHGEVWGDSKR
jgi:hypothetical protein